MVRYKNLSRTSGIARFEFDADSITIEFEDGSTYLYDSEKPGRHEVEQMKVLARAGKGLCEYINKHVRSRYACKLK